MTTPDPILAAIAAFGGIEKTRATIHSFRVSSTLPKAGTEPPYDVDGGVRALCDLADGALDAMGRPAGGDAMLLRLKDWAYAYYAEGPSSQEMKYKLVLEIDRLLSEPAPASDGRTGSCAECERLNADVLAYRRKERKILGLPDEALAEDHIDAITSLKNDKDGWEAECEMQRVTKQRIIAERDEARAECERLAMELAAAHGILDATLGVLPVGNLATHTRDSIPDRVQVAMEQWGILGRVDDILMDAGFVFGDETTAADLVRELIRERDKANRDARNAADMMMTANNEAVRYMRERDAARADQAAMAKCIRRQRESLEDIERIASENQPEDPYVQHTPWTYVLVQCARAIGPMADMTDRLAALPAEKPAAPADAVKIAEWPVLVAEQARLLGEIEKLRQAVAPARDSDWPNSQFSTETTVDFAIRLLRYHGGIPMVADNPAEPAAVFHAAAKHCTGEMFGEQAAVKPASDPQVEPVALEVVAEKAAEWLTLCSHNDDKNSGTHSKVAHALRAAIIRPVTGNMHPVLYWLDDGKFARAMLVGKDQLVVDLTTGDGPSVIGRPDWWDAGYVAAYGGLVPECASEGTEPGQWSYGVAQLPSYTVSEKPAAPAPIGGPWGSMLEPNDDPTSATADAEALPADPNALREIIRQRAQALHDAKHKLAVMQRDVMRQRGEAFDREIKAILQGGGS